MTSVTTTNHEECMGRESSSGHTGLAAAMTNDTPSDYRSCPHKCYGTLRIEDGKAVCPVCRHTPDGEHIPTSMKQQNTTDNHDEHCFQSTWFYPITEDRGTHSSVPNPWGRWGENGTPDDPDESYYDISKKPRMFGGNWRVYSKDEETRPDGVTEDYTFDLTTLSIKRN